MIVLVDQDDVLNDFNAHFQRIWKPICPPEFYVPPEKQKIFNLQDNYPQHLRQQITDIYTAPGFVFNLPPIEAGINAVKEMMRMGLDVYICTSPLPEYENCVLEKYKWVERFFGRTMTRKLILTGDKTLIKGKFLIDDKPEIFGSEQPAWERVVYDRPWNQNSKAIRLYGWKNWKLAIGV